MKRGLEKRMILSFGLLVAVAIAACAAAAFSIINGVMRENLEREIETAARAEEMEIRGEAVQLRLAARIAASDPRTLR
ncbi:MAG: hypothetical protein AB1742_09855, partial [bacterium]